MRRIRKKFDMTKFHPACRISTCAGVGAHMHENKLFSIILLGRIKKLRNKKTCGFHLKKVINLNLTILKLGKSEDDDD